MKTIKFLIITLLATMTMSSYGMLKRFASFRTSFTPHFSTMRTALQSTKLYNRFVSFPWRSTIKFGVPAKKIIPQSFGFFKNPRKYLALTGLGSGLLYSSSVLSDSTVPWQNLKSTTIKELKNEEENLHRQCLELCGLSEEIWQQKRNELLIAYAQKNKRYKRLIESFLKEVGGYIPTKDIASDVNQQIKEHVHGHLIQNGIDTNKVNIFYNDTFSANHLGMHIRWSENKNKFYDLLLGKGFTVHYINDSEKRKMFDGLLYHEINHLLNDDILERGIHTYLVFKHAPDREKAKKYLRKFLSFQEKRADIMACLSHPDRAIGLSNHFYQTPTKINVGNGNQTGMFSDESRIYPTNLDRHNYCKHYYDQMQQAVAEKNNIKHAIAA